MSMSETQRRPAGRWAVVMFLAVLAVGACGAATEVAPVDLLITGGRVMDPETELDAVLNLAVRDGVIVAVSDEAPEAREVLDATGLVVAPGFIDLHGPRPGPGEPAVSGTGRGDRGDGAGDRRPIPSTPGMRPGRDRR